MAQAELLAIRARHPEVYDDLAALIVDGLSDPGVVRALYNEGRFDGSRFDVVRVVKQMMGGRQIWRAKPLDDGGSWAEPAETGRYRVFFAIEPALCRVWVMAVELREGRKDDIYEMDHPVSRRLRDLYDSLDLRRLPVYGAGV
jgi:hypothetical protein